MEENHIGWLPHLSEAVVADAHGYNLDAYVVALEGWRRGLTLTWHAKESKEFPNIDTWFVDTPGRLFSLSSDNRTHYFFRSRGDRVTNEAVKVGKDKEMTKSYLAKKRLPIAEGRPFNLDHSLEDVKKYVSTLDFPVVLKPVDGSFGRGVITDITSNEELDYALVYLHKELKTKDVIVERHVYGDEYRIYVVGDQVVGAINRIPANVVGDGINTIKDLIKNKNKKRNKNPRLISCPINIDYALEVLIDKNGYNIDSIPAKGEQVFLRDKSNISLGGDPIDVLDQLSVEVKNTAVNALHAIPGLEHGAIDLIVNASKPDQVGAILEVNPTAQIGSILFPLKGKARDVPAAIIDYYFPETVNKGRSKFYFDFNEALKPLNNKVAVKTTVTSLKSTDFYAKQIVCKNESSVNPHSNYDIIEIMKKYDLHGFITKKGEEFKIVVAGYNVIHINGFLDELNSNGEFVIVGKKTCNDPIMLGIKAFGDRNTLIEQFKQHQKEKGSLKVELQKVEKQYTDMMNSRLWKATKPIRKMLDVLKGK